MCKGLILETSTHKSIVAFIDSVRTTHLFFIENKKELSNQIFQILQNTKIPLEDLSFIGIGIGPGSYTGVRVSATIGKALSYAQNIPIVSFCSLKALIPSFKEGTYLGMLDAKSDGVYIIKAHKAKDKTIFESPLVLSVAAASELIKKNPIICSNETHLLKEKFLKIQATWIDTDPDIGMLTTLCLDKWKNKDFTDQMKLQPLYLRGS